MSVWGWVGIGILAFLFLFIIINKKRKSKKLHKSCRKHPSGVKLYHEKTKIRLRAPFNKTSSKKSESSSTESKIAVLDFKGDVKASGRFSFSKLVDEIVLNSKMFDEVVVRVESPGGGVSEYGFLFAEMARMRSLEEDFKLTVCVDTVAASGGFLMSLPAHKIIAAPFSMVGSIGVVSFIPNIREFLEERKIKPRTFTAGDYKRTVTLTDDASEEDVAQYQKQLSLIHDQFKTALKNYRPDVDLSKVATGEAWLASTSKDLGLGLVDELMVSSEYLLRANQESSIQYYSFEGEKPGLLRRIAKNSGQFSGLLRELI